MNKLTPIQYHGFGKKISSEIKHYYNQSNKIFKIFFFSICLDVPHLTNEHRTHQCTTSGRGQLCIFPV